MWKKLQQNRFKEVQGRQVEKFTPHNGYVVERFTAGEV